jgi:hypothetical protein
VSEAPEFTLRQLAVLAYAQKFTQWLYQQRIPIATICAAKFFSPAWDMFAAGDHIHVSGADGAAILWVVSSSMEGGVVTKPMART